MEILDPRKSARLPVVAGGGVPVKRPELCAWSDCRDASPFDGVHVRRVITREAYMIHGDQANSSSPRVPAPGSLR